MARRKRKSTWKVGVTKTKMRTIRGKRKRVRVTKMSKGRYKIRVEKRKKR